jgi:glycosyltransferase involved in cell wall biosynthesis
MQGIRYVSEAPTTGFGRAAREYMRQLAARGIPLTWTPMVPGRGWGRSLEPFLGRDWPDETFGPLTNRPIEYDTVILHLQPDDMLRWRIEEPTRATVGMTSWEFDRVPGHWPRILNSLRGVVVPCRWNHASFLAGGVSVPMAVIPHLAPPLRPGPSLHLPGVRDDDFVFYSIAAWRERNAPHLALEAFLREFCGTDRVAMVLKTSRINERRPYRGFFNYHVRRHFDTTLRQVAAIRRRCVSDARAVVLLDDLDEAEIAALHARGDAYVSLTRTEGWGLGAYEAAWAGNPVIITGHGGQLDYLPSDATLFVDHATVPFHDPFFHPSEPLNRLDVTWANPDVAMAGRLMRLLAADPAAARQRGAVLRAHVEERFASAPVMNRLLDFLNHTCGT